MIFFFFKRFFPYLGFCVLKLEKWPFRWKFFFLESGHSGYTKNREFYADFEILTCLSDKMLRKKKLKLKNCRQIWQVPIFMFFNLTCFGSILSLRYIYIFKKGIKSLIFFLYLIWPIQEKYFTSQKGHFLTIEKNFTSQKGHFF